MRRLVGQCGHLHHRGILEGLVVLQERKGRQVGSEGAKPRLRRDLLPNPSPCPQRAKPASLLPVPPSLPSPSSLLTPSPQTPSPLPAAILLTPVPHPVFPDSLASRPCQRAGGDRTFSSSCCMCLWKRRRLSLSFCSSASSPETLFSMARTPRIVDSRRKVGLGAFEPRPVQIVTPPFLPNPRVFHWLSWRSWSLIGPFKHSIALFSGQSAPEFPHTPRSDLWGRGVPPRVRTVIIRVTRCPPVPADEEGRSRILGCTYDFAGCAQDRQPPHP